MSKDEYEDFKALFQQGKDIEGAVILNEKSWDGKLENISTAKMTSFNMTHGELKGYQSVIDEVGKYQDELDGLAKAVAYAVNTIHMDDGSELDGHNAFFVGSDDTGDINTISAKNIKIHQDIIDDVGNINTGKEYPPSSEGDGERALAIAQLRNARLDILGISNGTEATYDEATMTIENMSGGTTVESYFKDIVAKLGISTQQANRMVDNQGALTGQLIQRRDSISGVSLDEEIANLVQFQHAYQANSKVISTLTLMLDTLINGMGV